MGLKDTLLALLVVAIWGVSFVAMQLGLQQLSPLLLGGLRCLLLALPAIFLLPRPALAAHTLILYGLLIGFGQFAFLFFALHGGLSAGVAAMLLQLQLLFTVLLGTLLFGERIRASQILALLFVFAGVALLLHQGADGLSLPDGAILFALGAALCLALGNLLQRLRIRDSIQGSLPALIAWAALAPILPFFLAAWLFDGGQATLTALRGLDLTTLLALLYLAYIATHLAYAIWGRLLRRNHTGYLMPFTLLIPLIALAADEIVFATPLSAVQLYSLLLILLGLALALLGNRLMDFRLVRH
ncbi:EamA family transporter [Edwardsiella tarda]